jgi:hypothetical protein
MGVVDVASAGDLSWRQLELVTNRRISATEAQHDVSVSDGTAGLWHDQGPDCWIGRVTCSVG